MKTAGCSESFVPFLDALLAGDKPRCRALVEQLLDQNVSALSLYVDYFSAALYEIGHRWEHGQISVAVEHLATVIVEDLMAQVFARVARPGLGRKRAVVFCGADELHQVGGRMVADTLELSGWDVAFLGANTPTEDLVNQVESWNPHLAALSVTLERNLEKAVETLHALHRSRPHLLLLAGGQAVSKNLPKTSECPGVTTLSSLPELLELSL